MKTFVAIMMDSAIGMIFAILGAAYVLAKMPQQDFSQWFTSDDVLWVLGAVVVVAALMNAPGAVRSWLKSE